MTIRISTENDKVRWDEYVMKSESSSLYHLYKWKKIIESCFGHQSFYILSENSDGVINGILPLINLKSFLFGNYFVSVPFFNYGGICAESSEVSDKLFNKAREIAIEEGAKHIELRHTANIFDDHLPVKTTKISMWLDIPGNSEELWNTMPSKLRSQIRRPQKEKMFAKWGKTDELENFYNVFSLNMRDLGTPVYSKCFFKTILDEIPDSSWICTIFTEDEKPVASGFFLGFKKRLEIPWASSLKKFNHYSPNMLLYWEALKFASDNEFNVFDFGRSTYGEGTYKFKKQWGAKPVQLYWHYWLSDGDTLPELNPKNAKYEMAIKIWRKLPVALTKVIGPEIIKYLP